MNTITVSPLHSQNLVVVFPELWILLVQPTFKNTAACKHLNTCIKSIIVSVLGKIMDIREVKCELMKYLDIDYEGWEKISLKGYGTEKKIPKEIRDLTHTDKGLYVYVKSDKNKKKCVLYISQGKLRDRLKAHYREAWSEEHMLEVDSAKALYGEGERARIFWEFFNEETHGKEITIYYFKPDCDLGDLCLKALESGKFPLELDA